MAQPPAVPALQIYRGRRLNGSDAMVPDPLHLSFEAHLEQLFECIPDGVVLLDPEDRVLRVNHEFCRMFGYLPEDVLGRAIGELIVPDSLLDEATALVRAALRGERVVTETVRQRSDGTLLDVLMLEVGVRISGEPVGTYGLYRDISEQKRIEAERNELLARERRGHFESAASTSRRDQILAAAAALLAADGRAEALLARLARFLVPELADSCIVYLRNERGQVRRVEVAFADPAQEALLREQLRSYPPELARLIPPVARTLNTGEPQLLPEVSIGALKAVPGDSEHVSVALLVGLSSLLVVPLVVRGRTVGAISLGTAESGRRYHVEDLALAEEIARHAAALLAERLP